MDPHAHETRAPIINGVTAALTALGTICYLARAYTRAVLLKCWYLDDVTLFFGWICGLCYLILVCTETKYGVGRHIATISPEDLVVILKLQWVSYFFYHWGMGLVKLGICIFYRRLFEDSLMVKACMGFIVATMLLSSFLTLFYCNPINAYWDLATFSTAAGRARCMPVYLPFFLVSGVYIFAASWLMLIILPKVYNLKLPRRQKVILLTVISLGWTVVLTAIYRTVRVSKIVESADTTWTAYDTTISTALDVNVSIICASVPCTRPLLRKVVPSFVSWLAPRNRSASADNMQSISLDQRRRMGSTSVSGQANGGPSKEYRTSDAEPIDSVLYPSHAKRSRMEDEEDPDEKLFNFRSLRLSNAHLHLGSGRNSTTNSPNLPQQHHHQHKRESASSPSRAYCMSRNDAPTTPTSPHRRNNSKYSLPISPKTVVPLGNGDGNRNGQNISDPTYDSRKSSQTTCVEDDEGTNRERGSEERAPPPPILTGSNGNVPN